MKLGTCSVLVARCALRVVLRCSYSGSTAAWAHRHLKAAVGSGCVRRVFVLGPSHHVYLDTCALPSTSSAATPLGDLSVDTDVVRMLAKTVRPGRIVHDVGGGVSG